MATEKHHHMKKSLNSFDEENGLENPSIILQRLDFRFLMWMVQCLMRGWMK